MTGQRTKKITAAFFTVFLFLVALPASAALVNCGNEGQNPCTFSDLFSTINGVISFITTTIVPLLAVLGFVIAGVMMMTSAGDPGKFQQAKKAMIWIAIGVIIVYLAWFIVESFVSALGGQSWTLQFFNNSK